MREMIQNWLSIGVNNPQDDERLYKIVIESMSNKAEYQDFIDANGTLGGQYDVDKLYKRYEDLYCFINYLKRKGILLLDDKENSGHYKI